MTEPGPASRSSSDIDSLYGYLAEFSDIHSLCMACRRAVAAGYQVDAFSPYPSEELKDSLGLARTAIPLIVLISGILGGAAGYGLQYWINLSAYPLNVGGRPLHSWPAFIPATFECTILSASLSAIIGMLILNGLPRPHHPLFAVPRFESGVCSGFFLCIEFDQKLANVADDVCAFLESCGAVEVWYVPAES